MKYTVVVFFSRTDTMKFYNYIKNYGLFCAIINTPRQLSHSCGISTKIDPRLVIYAKTIINKLKLSSFKGIFLVEIEHGKELIKKII